MPTTAPLVDRRHNAVLWAQYGVAHRDAIHYKEIRPIPGKFELGMTLDCSGYFTLCYKQAGIADDPNGFGYNGQGYTGSLLNHGHVVTPEQALPGDAIVYGPGTGWHVAMIVQLDPVHHNHLTVSHGQESDPNYCHISQDGRMPQRILRFNTMGHVTADPGAPVAIPKPPAVITPAVQVRRPVLHLGATGPDVATLQTLLRTHGSPSLAVDGIYGAQTLLDVKAVESAHHLPLTDVVDANLWIALGH